MTGRRDDENLHQAGTDGPACPRVLVVDDDDSMRSALRRLFHGAGLRPEVYSNGVEFLEQANLQEPGCIVLDLQMPGMDGLAVQNALKQREVDLPLIFLTGSAAIRHAVEAMQAGAADFVEKPFENHDLLSRVGRAFLHYARERAAKALRQETQERFEKLSPRENEVLSLLVKGMTNKEIANMLGTSYRTVENQRSHIMQRMQADSLADLVRMYLQTYGQPGAR